MSPSRRIRAALLATLLAGSCGHEAPPTRTEGPESLLVICVDTLRRDRLGVYSSARELTPNLDALAAESLVFTRATAPSSWTKPSVASLFTGLYPSRHGALGSRGDRPELRDLAAEPWCLAEALRDAGRRTAGFVNNPHLDAARGFGRGFGIYEQPAGGAHDLLAKAARWIEEGEGPYFLYVHLIEPHAPYEPQVRFRDAHVTPSPGVNSPFTSLGNPIELALWSQAYRGWLRRGAEGTFEFDEGALRVDLLKEDQLRQLQELDPSITRETLLGRLELDFQGYEDPRLRELRDHLVSRYDAEVAQTDDELGVFLRRLGAGGHLADAALVFTSDHGEAFLEHGLWGHQGDLSAEQLAVPLLLRARVGGKLLRGEVERPTSLVDLAPTLAEALGVRTEDDLDGSSLWSDLMSGEARVSGTHTTFAELYVRDLDHVAASDGRYKLVRFLDRRTPVTWRGYDLELDPGERSPLEPDDPRLATLRERLDRYLERRERDLARHATGDAGGTRTSEDLQRQLDALGY